MVNITINSRPTLSSIYVATEYHEICISKFPLWSLDRRLRKAIKKVTKISNIIDSIVTVKEQHGKA